MGMPRLMLVFLLLCYINISPGKNNGNYTSLDHNKLSGRWYLFMDNTYGDFEVESNGKLLNTLYRYFPDLQECRTTSLLFNPISSDSSPEMAVEFEVIRRSTNDVLGTQKILYIDDDSTRGFVIMHQESNQMDTYLVVTRSKNPSDQRTAINIALLDLNLNPEIFSEKSTNYGCETMTEQGFDF